MKMTRHALRLCLALSVLLLPTAPAAAAGTDGDRDGMADRWESTHRVFNPDADADRDGLRNLREYRLRLKPRDEDTDNDGAEDGFLRFAFVSNRSTGTATTTALLMVTVTGTATGTATATRMTRTCSASSWSTTPSHEC